MGDVVNSMKRALRNGKAWTLVLAAATIWSGPAAATSESVAQSSEPVPPAAAPAALPATISRLAVMEGAPGTRIELVADSALVWTTYRDADGALVIELPNSRPLDSVHAENPPAGLVSAVNVAVDETSDRPLTRLTVRTRQEAEHTLVAGPNSLHIDLNPAGVARLAAPVETVAVADAPEAAPAAAAPAPGVSFASLGTPDRPHVAPPPTGRLASLLGSVDVIEDGAATVVRIAGDLTGQPQFTRFDTGVPAPSIPLVDSYGTLWFGNGGASPMAVRIDGDLAGTPTITQIDTTVPSVGFPILDAAGNLWFGTTDPAGSTHLVRVG